MENIFKFLKNLIKKDEDDFENYDYDHFIDSINQTEEKELDLSIDSNDSDIVISHPDQDEVVIETFFN